MTKPLQDNRDTQAGRALPGVRAILIFAMNLLGDSICRLPAIAAAGGTYPGSRVIVVAAPRYAEIFEGQPFIDEVWTLDRTGAKLAQLIGWLRLARRARSARPELVLDLYGSKRTALVSRLTGARWRAGLHGNGRSRWYNLRPARPLPKIGHIIEQINAAVAPAGVAAPFRYLPVAVADPDRAAAREALADVGLADAERLVLLNPSARAEAKRWPAERFGRLGRALAAAAGGRCRVITAPGEEAVAQQVVQASEGRAAALPALSIKQLAAVLAMARLVVTGDTGVLHLATAIGAPSVILAGPTDPRLVAYPEVQQLVLFHREACAQWRGGEQCADYNECAKRRCIDAITVEEVLAAVKTVLGLGGRGA